MQGRLASQHPWRNYDALQLREVGDTRFGAIFDEDGVLVGSVWRQMHAQVIIVSVLCGQTIRLVRTQCIALALPSIRPMRMNKRNQARL